MSMQKNDQSLKASDTQGAATQSLDADQWRAAFRKLDELLTLPAEERAAVLAANDAGTDGRTVLSAVRDWCERTTGLNANSSVTLGGGIGSAAADVLGTIIASQPGQQFGNYVLLDQIGQGGMGSVWRAERSDGLYKAQVAVKMLGAMALSSHARARFAQEGETLALLSHPNIARLLDAGITPEGRRFLVLELVQGLSLNEYVKQHALSPQQKLALFRQLLSALAFAHDRLVVHRDLKPSNVMVTSDGTLKLLDFGVSKLLDDSVTTDGDLTRDYGAAYTEAYAPPEQMRGEPTATGADIFALGVLLHELMGGERVTWSRKKFDVQPGDQPANLNRIESLDLRSIVRKAVEVSPADRYRTALAMDEDIARYMAGDAVLAHEGGFTRVDSRIAHSDL
jgi:eukaryotic-like serine/threonine-protein kinase